MRVLDLFCGAGGAAMGLHRAWPEAEILGVDIELQPHYPFRFVQDDAVKFPVAGYDFVWASPPCQAYSRGGHWVRGKKNRIDHPDLIAPIRGRIAACKAWVIENVEGAPLINPVMLCGSMFGLRIAKGYLRRHRLFEASFLIMTPWGGRGQNLLTPVALAYEPT